MRQGYYSGSRSFAKGEAGRRSGPAIASGGSVHGMLRLTLDAHEVAERVHRFWLSLAAVAAVVLGAVGVIGWAVARSVTRPLRESSRIQNY